MPQAFLKALAPFTVLQIATTATCLMMKGLHHEEVSFIVLFLITLAIPAMIFADAGCHHNNWGPWKTEKAATCQSEGVDIRNCKVYGCCGHDRRKTAKLEDCNRNPATCTKPATCPTCGSTSGKPKGHTFTPATCASRAKCTVCQYETGSLGSHDFPFGSCKKKVTCKNCTTTVWGKQHSFISYTCLEPAVCRHCGHTQNVAHNWVISGNRRVCSYCGTGQILRNPEIPLTE